MVSPIFDCLLVKNIQNKVPNANKECTLGENRPMREKVYIARSRNLMRLLKKSLELVSVFKETSRYFIISYARQAKNAQPFVHVQKVLISFK
jgi:hypothetical protein